MCGLHVIFVVIRACVSDSDKYVWYECMYVEVKVKGGVSRASDDKR